MPPIQSVAIIGAGAAGAAAAVALRAEDYYKTIKVFERRESAGGTWIYDADPGTLPIHSGALPPGIDLPIPIPQSIPTETNHDSTQRYSSTPIYDELTTNVPDIAMCFTDLAFPYGPFVPHWIPRQYIEHYYSYNRADCCLVLNTAVEDVSSISDHRWSLTLRRYDAARQVDTWWVEEFDALVIASGHYSVPFIPNVQGLMQYVEAFPGRVEHSKVYRTPHRYANERVLVIGNSASGHDVAMQLLKSKVCKGPIYVSRHSRSRWDKEKPPNGVIWKPIISKYNVDGTILFADGTKLSNVDKIIYCTGYKPSYPFWNIKNNGRPLYSYNEDRLINNYQHTFVWDFPTLAFLGMPRVLTFRSFEYQGIAVARLWSGRSTQSLPPMATQKVWMEQRAEQTRQRRTKFHQIEWGYGETMGWFRYLFELAGLPKIEGIGKCPPVLDERTRWAIEHIRKYPEPDEGGDDTSYRECGNENQEDEEAGWIKVEEKDSLHFV